MKASTVLLRQVNPRFLKAGRVTRQAFLPVMGKEEKPPEEDPRLLSVYDGDLIQPVDAFEHYTRLPRCSSCGVVGVRLDEVEGVGLSARPDPGPFPEHAVIDMTTLEGNALSRKAKELSTLAAGRGWLHGPVR